MAIIFYVGASSQVSFYMRVQYLYVRDADHLQFFFTCTVRPPISGSFPFIFTHASRDTVMSGIENKEGGRHCYLNALLQCMSINDILYQDLQTHNVNHIMLEGKY